MEVTKWLKPSISVSRIGDSASVQAATRVNAEQASKRTMCGPTRLPYRGRLKWLGEMSEEAAVLVVQRWILARLRDRRFFSLALKNYATYYNGVRTYRSLQSDAPVSRPVQRSGAIISHAILGGLHHHYVRI